MDTQRSFEIKELLSPLSKLKKHTSVPAHAGVIGYYLPLSLSHLKLVEILWGITLEAAGGLFVTTGDITVQEEL